MIKNINIVRYPDDTYGWDDRDITKYIEDWCKANTAILNDSTTPTVFSSYPIEVNCKTADGDSQEITLTVEYNSLNQFDYNHVMQELDDIIKQIKNEYPKITITGKIETCRI